MRKFLVATLVIVLTAGIWYGVKRGADSTTTPQDDSSARQYVFEAQGVRLRQMDAAGKLQFEVEAEHIAQLPEDGGMLASTLTLYHDPPGTTAGGPNRWTLRAREGRLPNEGRIVSLRGEVRAQGMPTGSRKTWHVATEALDFNMDSQEVSADGKVDFTNGADLLSGQGLNANVGTGVMTLKSGHGKIVL